MKKIELIRDLSFGMPIIILGERDKYSIYDYFGFNADVDQYYLYDSLQYSRQSKNFTIDEN